MEVKHTANNTEITTVYFKKINQNNKLYFYNLNSLTAIIVI